MPLTGFVAPGRIGYQQLPGGPPPQPKPPPKYPQPELPPPVPTFQPPQPPQVDPRIAQLTERLTQTPTQAPAAPTDPRLAQLITQMQQQVATAQQRTAGPDARLEALIAQLASGNVAVPDVAGDPEARAFRVARQRELARARESEANRAAAQQGLQGGAFDARLAQLQEAAGEDIAGFEAGLSGRRRGEALEGLTQAAQLSLADLARQASTEQGRMSSGLGLMQALMGQQGLEREMAQRALESSRQSDQALLAQLLGERGRQEGLGLETGFRTEDLRLRQEEERLRRALAEQALLEAQEANRERQRSRPRRPGGGAVVRR